jgi:EF-hand domain pair
LQSYKAGTEEIRAIFDLLVSLKEESKECKAAALNPTKEGEANESTLQFKQKGDSLSNIQESRPGSSVAIQKQKDGKINVQSILQARRVRRKSEEQVLATEITPVQLKRAMKLINEFISEQDIHDMIDEADRSRSGKVSFIDFERMMRKTGLW